MIYKNYVIDNQAGAAFRSDLNNALAAIRSTNKSTGAPAGVFTGLVWVDDTNDASNSWTAKMYDRTDHIALFHVNKSSNIAGAAVLWDADFDTGVQVEEAADEDIIRFDTGGTEVASIVGKKFFIGATQTNTKLSQGLTIDQGAFDNEIVSLKSSDVSHGLTGTTETDTFVSLGKQDEGGGGLKINVVSDSGIGASSTLHFTCWADDANQPTSPSSTVSNMPTIHSAGPHDSAGNHGTFPANALVHSFAKYAASVYNNLVIIDTEGDVHVLGTDLGAGTFDAWDDARLLRDIETFRDEETPEDGERASNDYQRAPRIRGQRLVPSRYDASRYTPDDLRRAKVIGARIPDDEYYAAGVNRLMINDSAVIRILRGNAWQVHEMLDALFQYLEETGPGVRAKLRAKFVDRGLPTQILDWQASI